MKFAIAALIAIVSFGPANAGSNEVCDHVEMILMEVDAMKQVGEDLYQDAKGQVWKLEMDGEEGCLVKVKK